jgi:exosortase/archaeosortase family protein
MNRENIRWITSFVVLVAVFYWIDQSSWFQELVLDKLSLFTANATAWILSFIGLHLKQTGVTLITPTGPVNIAKSCTGSFVFLMFAAAILPFPTSWKSRLKGLALGLMTLLFINLFRTSLIVLVVSRFPGSLWTLHIVVGQIMVIAGMMGVFLWWLKENQQEIMLPFLKSNKTIFRALSLFIIGYLGGYWLYQLFLESPLGIFVKKLIEIHTLWIMSSLNHLFFQTQLTQLSAAPVRLIEGCLSSPMVVVFVAVIFAWPTRWWKRGVIILLGFIPFFYLYHLIRVILISVTLGTQSSEVNFAYNFYGQIFLSLTLFALVAYFWCSTKKSISYGKFFVLFMTSALIAALVVSGAGWLARHLLIPFLTERITGSTTLSYNPEQAISFTLDLQIFIWISLVGVTPDLTWTRKLLIGFSGVLIAMIAFAAGVAAIETLYLTPHKGLYKLSVILLPFAACYICFLRSETGPVSTRLSPEERMID